MLNTREMVKIMTSEPVRKKISDAQAEKMIDRVPLQNAQQIKARLDQLEKAERYEVVQSAMCYDVAMPPNRVDYLCPKCGARTVYSDFHKNYILELTAARREVQPLNTRLAVVGAQIRISLDETALCSRCSKGKTGSYALFVTTDRKGVAHRADLVQPEAIYQLLCLFQGKRYAGLTPLSEVAPKLRQLLGMDHEPKK